jgi:hypothetical protein
LEICRIWTTARPTAARVSGRRVDVYWCHISREDTMTKALAVAGAAAALVLGAGVRAHAQCATFIDGGSCTPAADMSRLAGFISGRAEPQLPVPQVLPPPRSAALETQSSAEPADCRMPNITAPNVDPRFTRAPAPDLHYAIRFKEAPVCPPLGTTRRFSLGDDVVTGTFRGFASPEKNRTVPRGE